MNNLSRLWGVGVVPSCLVPGPGVMRAEESWLLEYINQIEEVVWSITLEWLVCL